MKTALLLLLACAAALFSGCSTNRGGSNDDTYYSQNRPVYPSMPMDSDGAGSLGPPN